VVYKIDQELAGLGLEGPDAYLRDENGKPVPETVHKEDKKAQLYVLKRRRPTTWGKRPKIDAPCEVGGQSERKISSPDRGCCAAVETHASQGPAWPWPRVGAFLG
jgi:hypothetical protein